MSEHHSAARPHHEIPEHNDHRPPKKPKGWIWLVGAICAIIVGYGWGYNSGLTKSSALADSVSAPAVEATGNPASTSDAVATGGTPDSAGAIDSSSAVAAYSASSDTDSDDTSDSDDDQQVASVDSDDSDGSSYASSGVCDEDSYMSSSGDCVHRPVAAATAPVGATAQCNDGTYSFSEHHRGTCSYHGGVADWL
jgi:uncharacterized protein DUF3761